jgi:hypothetical protein
MLRVHLHEVLKQTKLIYVKETEEGTMGNGEIYWEVSGGDEKFYVLIGMGYGFHGCMDLSKLEHVL